MIAATQIDPFTLRLGQADQLLSSMERELESGKLTAAAKSCQRAVRCGGT